jgi:TetR/AcrR family transcriptional repressor of nem operon
MDVTILAVPAKRERGSDTAMRILDIAERLVQRRGFNGFSYADIAAELDITKATLHYYFAGKAELGRALIERYASRFMSALAEIEERHPDARARLEAYAGIYAAVLKEQRFCLCGMLAAEYETLPESMREAVMEFFNQNEAWLCHVLEAGQEQDTLRISGPYRDASRMIVSCLEGALLVARPYGDAERFKAAADQLLLGLSAAPITHSSAPQGDAVPV